MKASTLIACENGPTGGVSSGEVIAILFMEESFGYRFSWSERWSQGWRVLARRDSSASALWARGCCWVRTRMLLVGTRRTVEAGPRGRKGEGQQPRRSRDVFVARRKLAGLWLWGPRLTPRFLGGAW